MRAHKRGQDNTKKEGKWLQPEDMQYMEPKKEMQNEWHDSWPWPAPSFIDLEPDLGLHVAGWPN